MLFISEWFSFLIPVSFLLGLKRCTTPHKCAWGEVKTTCAVDYLPRFALCFSGIPCNAVKISSSKRKEEKKSTKLHLVSFKLETGVGKYDESLFISQSALHRTSCYKRWMNFTIFLTAFLQSCAHPSKSQAGSAVHFFWRSPIPTMPFCRCLSVLSIDWLNTSHNTDNVALCKNEI